ncbi:hypothetical protein C3E98_033075, partial [Pseudomonas sp. MWU13-2625]
VSAYKIAMQSGQDLNIQASQVAGSGTVSLMAGRDLNIRSGTDTQRVFQFHQEKTTGVFSGGGIGFTVGSKELTQEMNGAGSTQSQNRSLVGSINGDVELKGGGVLTLQGRCVTGGGNLVVDAKKQQLDAAVGTWHSVQKATSKSSGLTVQITSPLISGLQAAAAATDTVLSSNSYWGYMINSGKEFFDDEAWDKWVADNGPVATPGAVEFLKYAQSKGVE